MPTYFMKNSAMMTQGQITNISAIYLELMSWYNNVGILSWPLSIWMNHQTLLLCTFGYINFQSNKVGTCYWKVLTEYNYHYLDQDIIFHFLFGVTKVISNLDMDTNKKKKFWCIIEKLKVPSYWKIHFKSPGELKYPK